MSKPKSWTVLVYLCGDNNLDDAGVDDLDEMKKVGSTSKVNILAQFDRAAAGVNTRRFYLRRGTTVESDVVANLGETNMGDPNVLKDFITWGITKYPAKRYMVVLWNHGNGWDDTDVYRVARNVADRRVTRSVGGADTVGLEHVRSVGKRFKRALFQSSVATAVKQRGIAYDDNAQDFLDNVELKKVLLGVVRILKRKIDVVGMDACLMNMAEVAYQLRDVAHCTIGSEEVEPGDGWPYDKVLAALVKKPSQDGTDFGLTAVNAYLASYGKNDNVTQSAFNLAKVDGVVKAIDALAKALIAGLPQAAVRAGVVTARLQVQTFDHGERDYVDLIDFCDLLDVNVTVPDIKVATATLRKVFNGDFLVATGRRGPDVANAKGIAIYFPERPFSTTQTLAPTYAALDFTKNTVWDEFLKAYLKATARRR